MALIVWRSMYTGILSLGKNPGENPLSFKVYVCCIFGFQGKNWQRMSKVHLSGSQRCILNWPQVIFPNFKHRTSDLTFSLSRSMFIERSVSAVHVSARCGCDLAKLCHLSCAICAIVGHAFNILSTMSPKHSESDVSSSLVAQSFARCLLAGCGPITTNHWNVHCPITNHWNVHGNLYSNSFTLSILTVLTGRQMTRLTFGDRAFLFHRSLSFAHDG